MARTSTKRRLFRTVASRDVEPLGVVLQRTFRTTWDTMETDGEVTLKPDSPFWEELANQLDVHVRATAPSARHRSDD